MGRLTLIASLHFDSLSSMAETGQVVETDEVCPEGTSTWIRANKDLRLRDLFGTPAVIEPPVRSARSRRGRIKLLFTLAIAIILIWVAWPYYAIYDLMAAVRAGDVNALERRVTWDSVRQGLRAELNAMLLAKLSDSPSNAGSNLGNGLAAVLGPAIVNQAVDNYVTPQAIASAVRKNGAGTSNAVSGQELAPNLHSSIEQARRLNFRQIKYAFFSNNPFVFRVEIIPEREPALRGPATLLFHWFGDWRLTQIQLPPDILDKTLPSSPATSQVATSTGRMPDDQSSQQSRVEPTPIAIELLAKGFKSANPKASDYESAITFELSLKNLTNTDIRAFDGTLSFTDLLDNNVYSSKLSINDPLKSGSTIQWSGSIKYNQFMDDHQRLRNERQENLKLKFTARKVLFVDGSTKAY